MFKSKFTDINNKVQINENLEVCKECDGRCCKNMGCFISPKDLKSYPKITREDLIDLLETGYVSIDWYEGYGEEYFLRMRNKKSPIIDPSWGGECVALTMNGCSFKFEDRPYGGRKLIPSKNGICPTSYTKKECKDDWKPYIDILDQLVENIREGALEIKYDKEIDKLEPQSNGDDVGSRLLFDLMTDIFKDIKEEDKEDINNKEEEKVVDDMFKILSKNQLKKLVKLSKKNILKGIIPESFNIVDFIVLNQASIYDNIGYDNLVVYPTGALVTKDGVTECNYLKEKINYLDIKFTSSEECVNILDSIINEHKVPKWIDNVDVVKETARDLLLVK